MFSVLKRSLLLTVLFCIFIGSTDAQTSVIRKQLFDDDWRFAIGEYSDAPNTNFDQGGWRKVDLPHDWSIEGTIDKNNPSGGPVGFFPTGVGWYRKTFKVPSNWKNKKISVYFEGVYMNSEVFINGKSMGVHPYGYTSFTYDITPQIMPGKRNILAVRVDNSQQNNSRWYSGSGIYRHVWIVVTDPVHITNWGTAITTTYVTSKRAIVNLKTTLSNETENVQNIVLKTDIQGAYSRTAGSEALNVALLPKSTQSVSQDIAISEPLLWSPEKPTLYKANLQVIKGNVSVDQVPVTFGIRTLKFTTDSGFQLNGKMIKINGGCVHHDNGCLGAAAFDRAEERRVELLKSGGFNAVRTSHNPPSEAFLDACDKLGILVIDEAFDGWKTPKNKFDYAMYFDKWWQSDLQSMVFRDRNHPSIIMWSIGNEIIERKKPEAVETAKALKDFIHKIEPTRPVTSAMTTWDKEWEIFDPLMAAHDIAGYNYQLNRAESDHLRVPSRIIVQTESYPKNAFANWKLAKDHSYILGDFVWTALDYLGESGIGRWYQTGEPTAMMSKAELFPYHGAYCGDIDLTGWRKPISHYRSMLYNSNEMLYFAVREPEKIQGDTHVTSWGEWPTWESWNWPGFEGQNIQVEIYSRYPKVRLYLSGKLIGEKPTTEIQEFRAIFLVPYAPGELRVAGLLNEKEMESRVLKTAGDAIKISVSPDRKNLKASGQDLSFVTVEITDKNGYLQPNEEHILNFSLEGAGVIAGVDNGNLKDPAPYVAKSRETWHGRALVVIKSGKKAGKVRLTVSSLGLKSTVVELNVLKN